jgi:hypothetical protein
MTFEFTYAKHTYEYDYESGYINKIGGEGSYPYCTPQLRVSLKLREILDDFSSEQLEAIMSAVLNGYLFGLESGKKAKIQEFKNMFGIE